MSYTKHSLLNGEEILYCTKPHWILIFEALPWLLLAWLATKFSVGAELMFGNLFKNLLTLYAGWSLLGTIIRYYNTEYALTNRRILVKTGFIRINSLELFLDRIEGAAVNQSVLGRIGNFGTVVIAGIGGTKNAFPYVPDPLRFRSRLQEQLPRGG